MSETTLNKKDGVSETSPSFQRDAWLLGNELVPNFERALSPEQVSHYRNNKREYIPALQRGFVLPGQIPLPAVPVETSGYPLEETDCFQWLGHMERFSRERFGKEIALRDTFPLPTRLPWKQVLPIYDPGLTNREMVDKALKAQGLLVGEGTNVEKFTGSDAESPRLWLVERTLQPRAARGLPPKFATQYFEGRQTRPLNLRGYGIGTGLLYKVEKTFLDPNATTASWFPENTLPGGGVAYGYYFLADGGVWFDGSDALDEDDGMGFREAILLLQT